MSNGILSDYAYMVTDRIDVAQLSSQSYVGVDNLLPNRGGRTDSEYVPTEGTATAFKTGDVLIGNIRPYFKKIWLADRDGGCSNDVLAIRSLGDVIPTFLYAVLSTDQFFDYDMAGSKGSKMPRGDKDHIMRYPITVSDSQEEIGLFIQNIKEKISLNTSICSDLESMAKTLYDYWFVQFDFPNENGKPYKSSGGKMVYSEELHREIPEGWEVKNFSDILNFSKGKIPSKLNNIKTADMNSPYITIDVANGSLPQFCNANSMIACNGETIMVMDGAASGDVYIGNCGSLGSTFSMLPSKRDDISNALIYMLLKGNMVAYKRANTGSTVPHANRTFIEKMKIALPSDCSMISERFDLLVSKQIHSKEENIKLASLRDFLLPMLMNGQVKVGKENSVNE